MEFLRAFIKRAIFGIFLGYSTCESFRIAKQEWIDKKVEELLTLEEFDFQKEKIRAEYESYMQEKIYFGEIIKEIKLCGFTFPTNIDEPVPSIKKAMARMRKSEARIKAKESLSERSDVTKERLEGLEEGFEEEPVKNGIEPDEE